MTCQQQLRRALRMCLDQMSKGRPSSIYPDDCAAWDRAVQYAETALQRGQSDRVPSMCPTEE